MTSLAEAKERIHNYEYAANGMRHLNNSGVSVRNLKRIKGGYKADIILFLDDIQERHNGMTYPDGFEKEGK